jgi:hypothetical protein
VLFSYVESRESSEASGGDEVVGPEGNCWEDDGGRSLIMRMGFMLKIIYKPKVQYSTRHAKKKIPFADIHSLEFSFNVN